MPFRLSQAYNTVSVTIKVLVQDGCQGRLLCVARNRTTFQRFLWYAVLAERLETLIRLREGTVFAASQQIDSHLTDPRQPFYE